MTTTPTTPGLTKGVRVRFLACLGTMTSADATRFVGSVNLGDEGVYLGPHPDKRRKAWHLAQAADGTIVLMSRGQFEVTP